MAKIYYERDANLDLLKGKTVAIIGFGSQGHAHAQNLRDAGCDVIVGALPSGRSWKAAKKARFDVATAAAVARRNDHASVSVVSATQPPIIGDNSEPMPRYTVHKPTILPASFLEK